MNKIKKQFDTIREIAYVELKTLFYSPIAWLILIIFIYEASRNFMEVYESLVRSQTLKYSVSGVTQQIFTGWSGVFSSVQNNLYLYIPLLTMGLISRETNSGSIKLLYSSPITNTQIILGKYLSMLMYGFVLMIVLGVYVLFALFTVKDIEIGLVFSGMLGIYLLIGVYTAIGLFMSTLTSFQIVAAIATLAVLSLLNYIGTIGQETMWIRDVTYWLSMVGRTANFMKGMISSKDIIYFISVTSLFIIWGIIKLQTGRKRSFWLTTIGKYSGVFVVIVLIGYMSSRPQFMTFYDATSTKSNTLTKSSQMIVDKLEGGLTITAYTNLLEDNYWMGLVTLQFKQRWYAKDTNNLDYVSRILTQKENEDEAKA